MRQAGARDPRLVTSRALGDGDWRPSLNWLDVIELRGG